MNKFIEGSFKIMPYIFLMIATGINLYFFILPRVRLINISFMNYVFVVLFQWIILMIYFFMKEDLKEEKRK